MPKLSIIVPVYNEAQTIEAVLEQLSAFSMDKEIIAVDDGSRDGTAEKIKGLAGAVKVFQHDKNQGKGAAIRTGLAGSSGDFIVFCDADLEYDVNQITELFDYILQNNSAVVYGSRFLDYQPQKNHIHYWGNRFLTWLTNQLFGGKLTDMETAYKMFRADVVKNLDLTARRFEIEPEITAKILKQGLTIVELPISYNPRVKEEGKKIKYRDGFKAILMLIKEKIN